MLLKPLFAMMTTLEYTNQSLFFPSIFKSRRIRGIIYLENNLQKVFSQKRPGPFKLLTGQIANFFRKCSSLWSIRAASSRSTTSWTAEKKKSDDLLLKYFCLLMFANELKKKQEKIRTLKVMKGWVWCLLILKNLQGLGEKFKSEELVDKIDYCSGNLTEIHYQYQLWKNQNHWRFLPLRFRIPKISEKSEEAHPYFAALEISAFIELLKSKDDAKKRGMIWS